MSKSKTKRKFIRMNVELPGFPQGQQWLYDEAPDSVKKWCKNKSILFETIICSIVKEEKKVIIEDIKTDNEILFRKFNIPKTKKQKESGKVVKKETKKRKRKKNKKKKTKSKKYNSTAPKCKGIKADGNPCKNTKLVKNGYCRHHKSKEGES